MDISHGIYRHSRHCAEACLSHNNHYGLDGHEPHELFIVALSRVHGSARHAMHLAHLGLLSGLRVGRSISLELLISPSSGLLALSDPPFCFLW